MNTQHEALISRYFDREMSPSEEQDFLISLAASDDMRLAFRSQLELLKAVHEDTQLLGSVADIRGRTLTMLGFAAAAATPIIEQALSHSSARANAIPAAPAKRSPFNFFTNKIFLTTSCLVAGFLAGALTMNSPHSEATTAQPLAHPAEVRSAPLQPPIFDNPQSNPTKASVAATQASLGTQRNRVHTVASPGNANSANQPSGSGIKNTSGPMELHTNIDSSLGK